MFKWIAENIATTAICAALALMVGACVIKLVKDRKKGKASCGCGCSDCAMADSCRGKMK